MNLIVALPIVCCVIIFLRYSSLLKAELLDTQSIIDRYGLYSTLEKGAAAARDLRLSVTQLNQQNSTVQIQEHIAKLEMVKLSEYGLPDTEKNNERLNEVYENYKLLDEAVEAELEADEIIDIANTTITAVLTLIATQPVEVDDNRLHNGMNSYITLLRLQDAASIETAFMSMVNFTSDAGSYRDELIANKGKQQEYIDDYIQRYATEAQVKKLLTVVTSNSFEAANNSYMAVVGGDQQAENINLAAANEREALLQSVISDIQSTTISEASELYSEANFTYKVTMAVVVILLMILIMLGYLIGRRTLRGLREIGSTLQAVEDKTEPNKRICIEGTDEFARLGTNINTLIDARQAGELIMIEAKEEAERANEAKSIFLANMSHEMRTPLNGIIGMGKILGGTDMSGVQKGYLQTIQSSSKALLGIINDVLDISKIESNSLVIAPVDVDTNEHVDDVISIIVPKAEENNLDIILDYSNDIPRKLVFDDLRVQQIVLNLMSNAVKFTESGTVTLQVSARPLDTETVELTYNVIDTGIGIREDKISAIFKPFEQEDASITRKFAGTGLGLTISKQLAELMGGAISATSELGKGSTFTLTVPAKHSTLDQPVLSMLKLDCIGNLTDLSYQRFITTSVSTDQPYAARVVAITDWSCADNVGEDLPLVVVKPSNLSLEGVEINESSIAALINLPATPVYIERKIREMLEEIEKDDDHQATITSAKTILIVEDNPVNQQVASIMLEDEGYTVYVADNGEEGVKAWREHTPDVILMDCMMPVMDGLTATETIRAIELEESIERCVPIIALTASTVDEDIKRCFDVGMNNYIPKPFELPLLLEAINKRYY